jgi:hypothetical protein
MHTKFESGNLKGGDCSEYIGIDVRIMLEKDL